MKRNLAILSAITVILSQAAFGTTQNYGTQSYGTMKCISNPMEPKDFAISYADNQRIVTYSNGTFIVNNFTSTKKYTIPGIKEWNNSAQLSSDRYRLVRAYDNTSKLYTYRSFDILTGKQNFLLETKTWIDADKYKLSNNGKILIYTNNPLYPDNSGIIANSTLGKSKSNLKFANFAKNIIAGGNIDSLYYWKNRNLNLIDLSSFKEYSVFKELTDKSILIFASRSSDETTLTSVFNQTSVFLKNADTLKGFFPRKKTIFDITGIKNPISICENNQETKLAIVTSDKTLVVYNIETKKIEKTINIADIYDDDVLNFNIPIAVFWNYDGSSPLLVSQEGVTHGRSDYDLSLIINNILVSMCPVGCDSITIGKNSFSYVYGVLDDPDFDGIYEETRSTKNGDLIKKTQAYLEEPDSAVILRKEKDFTLYKDGFGKIFFKQPKDYTITLTQDKQYCFISNSYKNVFYFYNVKTNKLYRTDYNVTQLLSFHVIKDKYVIILAADQHGNKYLNTFLLN
jgi:hypothetical protein